MISNLCLSSLLIILNTLIPQNPVSWLYWVFAQKLLLKNWVNKFWWGEWLSNRKKFKVNIKITHHPPPTPPYIKPLLNVYDYDHLSKTGIQFFCRARIRELPGGQGRDIWANDAGALPGGMSDSNSWNLIFSLTNWPTSVQHAPWMIQCLCLRTLF